MHEQDIINTFIQLCEGKLSPEAWKNWFAEHTEIIEKVCGRTYFLKIKPKSSFSDISNAYFGQVAVSQWLKSKNIDYLLSNTYEIAYNQEFNDFCKKEDEKRKGLKKSAEEKFGYLKEVFPKFSRQLTKSFDETTIIEKGKTTDEIRNKEKELGVIFSEELTLFFRYISVFKFESVAINFDDLEKCSFDEKIFLVLGEFWEYGDGDKLYYDIENQSIVVFAHEHQPEKLIKQAPTMTNFVEKNLVKHLKEYE